MRVRQLDTLKKCAGDIHSHQGNAVRIQFLQGFNSPTAAALSLRGIDDLPRLIVFLLEPVAGVVEIKNHRYQDRKSAQVFQNLQQDPVAEHVGEPFEWPLDREYRRHPPVFEAALPLAPRLGALPALMCEHDWRILRQEWA